MKARAGRSSGKYKPSKKVAGEWDSPVGGLNSSLLLAAQFLSNALIFSLSLKGKIPIYPCLQKKIQGQALLGRVRVGWDTAGQAPIISDCLKGDS